MVGRKEGQSKVLRAGKGDLRLKGDDEEGGEKQGMVYDVTAQEEKKGQSHTEPAKLQRNGTQISTDLL
jgi:hypothetical protein